MFRVPFLITDAELSLDNVPTAGWHWDEVDVTEAKKQRTTPRHHVSVKPCRVSRDWRCCEARYQEVPFSAVSYDCSGIRIDLQILYGRYAAREIHNNDSKYTVGLVRTDEYPSTSCRSAG